MTSILPCFKKASRKLASTLCLIAGLVFSQAPAEAQTLFPRDSLEQNDLRFKLGHGLNVSTLNIYKGGSSFYHDPVTSRIYVSTVPNGFRIEEYEKKYVYPVTVAGMSLPMGTRTSVLLETTVGKGIGSNASAVNTLEISGSFGYRRTIYKGPNISFGFQGYTGFDNLSFNVKPDLGTQVHMVDLSAADYAKFDAASLVMTPGFNVCIRDSRRNQKTDIRVSRVFPLTNGNIHGPKFIAGITHKWPGGWGVALDMKKNFTVGDRTKQIFKNTGEIYLSLTKDFLAEPVFPSKPLKRNLVPYQMY